MEEIPYGQRLLPQIVDMAAEQDPSRVIAMSANSSDISKGFRKLTISAFARAVDYVAFWIEGKIGKSRNFEIIAYIGINDFRYLIVELAAIKCGFPVLLPSLRNSDANNSSLFRTLNCTKFFYSDPYQSKASVLEVDAFCVPTLDEILSGNSPKYPYHKSWQQAKLDPVLIIHTSGTTGNPKPITYNNAFLAVLDSARKVPGAFGRPRANLSLLDNTVNIVGMPPFHAGGACSVLCQLFYNAVFVLHAPNGPPTGKSIVDIMGQLEVNALVYPPSLYDDLVKNFRQEFIDRSRSLTYVFNAGGPLLPATAELLVSRADLIQIYGQTETGCVVALIPEKRYHQYYQWHPVVGGTRMVKVGDDSDLYEMTVEKRPGQEWLQAVFHVFPDLDVWHTRDLFKKHPTEDLWTFKGRKDDVIVLNNGEKINPVGMEETISSHPLLTGALVVGASQDQVGLIIEGKEPKEDLVETVWPTIQRANEEAPRHARIYKDLVMTTEPAKPLRRTPKGTIQRSTSVQDYAERISALFKDRNESRRRGKGGLSLKLPKSTVTDLVRQGVAQQLGHDDFADSDDLYFLGFDSLHTTELANALADVLGPHFPQSASNPISARLVYDNPSIHGLSDVIFALLNPETFPARPNLYDVDQMAFNKIQDMVRKYTADLPQRKTSHADSKDGDEKRNVAVTGTTGFFGFYLLVSLLQDPNIGRITCLNRSPDAEAKFKSRLSSYHEELVLGKSRVEHLQISLAEEAFGLPQSTYQRLVDEVDVVIHNAWHLDFNHNLSFFENPHLIGVRTLIDWAIRSPRNMQICFISSISTVAYWPGYYPADNVNGEPNRSVEDKHAGDTSNGVLPPGPQATLIREAPVTRSRIPSRQLGYAQSKYAAELILKEAAQARDLRVIVLRPGQIVNPSTTAGPPSSRSEWFPLALQTSKHMRMVPDRVLGRDLVEFFPADQLANTVLDILHHHSQAPSNTSSSSSSVYNLVNPYPTPFAEWIPSIIQYFAEQGVEDVQVVPFQQWVAALIEKGRKEGDRALVEYPALRLREFFEGPSGLGDGGAAGRLLERENMPIETAEGCRVSRTMREMRAVSGQDVYGWLRDWEL